MTAAPMLSPDLPTLARLALALALGLLLGIERERRRKEAGLRTFAFASLLGAMGGLLGDSYALLALALLGVLIVLLNLETIRTGEGSEITTSAALLVTGYIGVLAGKGHTFTPTALGVVTAALLAWKEPLAGFSRAVTDRELRSRHSAGDSRLRRLSRAAARQRGYLAVDRAAGRVGGGHSDCRAGLRQLRAAQALRHAGHRARCVSRRPGQQHRGGDGSVGSGYQREVSDSRQRRIAASSWPRRRC